MKIAKYFKFKNYYNYLVFKFMDLYYPKSINKIVQTKFDNINVLIRANEDVGKRMLLNQFEIEELNFIKSQLPTDGVFIDIGANIGIFSLVMAAKSKDIQVHAFDPIKLNTSLLSSSIEINGFTNIIVNQTCIGNYDGSIEFSLSSDSAYSSILDSGRKTELTKIQVPIARLDSYVSSKKINRIDFIKIDVEGAEKLVIEGLSNILNNPSLRPKFMMIELCDINLTAFKTSVEEMVNLMSKNQYEPFIIKDNELINFNYNIHANKFDNIFFSSTNVF